jgi:hypothetical protein
MKKLCMIFATAAVLSACGGGGSSNGGGGGGGGSSNDGGGDSAQGRVNAFLAEVMRIVASSSESTEAIDIDALAVLAPEDTEPLALN